MISAVLALLGAVFTSLTTILAKLGLKKVNSNFATFLRTGIVIIFSCILCLIQNVFSNTLNFTYLNWIYLLLSGICTGLSWIFYFKAIKLGDVNKVAPIDKSSFILTSVLFLIFFFDDTTKGGNHLTISMLVLSMTLMLVGTMLMIDKKESKEEKKKNILIKNLNDKKEDRKSKVWFISAILSSVFASLVSLFIKLGLNGVNSSLGTFYRTIVVFIFALMIVLVKKDYKGVKNIKISTWIILAFSGIATGLAWICEYSALNITGSNPVLVSAIGKLSILLTMLFSFIFLKEKFSLKSIIGLSLLTIGIVLIIVFSL